MGHAKTTELDAMTDEELAERAALFGDDADEEGDEADDGIDQEKLQRVMREATERARRVRVDLDLLEADLKVESLRVTLIRTDGGTQMRSLLDDRIVHDYADAINSQTRILDWPFPPLEVYFDGEHYWLADGFHRLAAFVKVMRFDVKNLYVGHTLPAKVHKGDRRDAILHAAGANANHGLRRTNADKRKAVETLLRDEEWQKWTDVEIARRCAVDSKTVGNVRHTLTQSLEIPMIDARKTADGRTMKVENIGRKIEPLRKPTPTPTVEPTEPVYGVPSLKVEGFVSDLLYMRIDSETFCFALAHASIAQLEAAWRRVAPISDRDRFAKIGERHKLLELLKDAQALDELIEAAMPSPSPSNIDIINRDLDAYDAEMKQEVADYSMTARDRERDELIARGAAWTPEQITPLEQAIQEATSTPAAQIHYVEQEPLPESLANGERRHDHILANLITVPPNDGNFKSAFYSACKEQLIAALDKIPVEKNKSKREMIEARINKLRGYDIPDHRLKSAGFRIENVPMGPGSIMFRYVWAKPDGKFRVGNLTSPDLALKEADKVYGEYLSAQNDQSAPSTASTQPDPPTPDDIAAAGPVMPEDLAEAGFTFARVGNGMWAVELDNLRAPYTSNWHFDPMAAVEDARAYVATLAAPAAAPAPAAEPKTLSALFPDHDELQRAKFVIHETDQGWRYFHIEIEDQTYGPLRDSKEEAIADAKAVLAEMPPSPVITAGTIDTGKGRRKLKANELERMNAMVDETPVPTEKVAVDALPVWEYNGLANLKIGGYGGLALAIYGLVPDERPDSGEYEISLVLVRRTDKVSK